MTIENSRRTALVFGMLALGAIALAAPTADAASPVHVKPIAHPAAGVHANGRTSMPRSSTAHSQNHVDDPFASLLLG